MLKHPEPKKGEIFWTASRVRDTYVSFFVKKYQHDNHLSCPVVPYNDPTLLFINSGMAQFKPIFLGQVSPTSVLAKYKRVANTQKCIRAGGKHNDLDDVGKDSYHHTFFEMLGNWSFGDYFKVETIDMAWELLTEVYKIPKDRLYVTYFEGNDQVPVDAEAKELWGKHFAADRILPGDSEDNFWEMGPTGPCGPCSEIHYDRIGGRNAAHLVNKDDPDVIEIWNLVFMQFNRKEDGSLEKLPAKHIDTGMGFERVVSLLQDKKTNYDTDVFSPIFDEISKHVQVFDKDGKPVKYSDKYYEDDPDKIDMAYRVVADHIRTLTVAVTDGAIPSNEGRGYVLRRIIRRAVRYSREILKLPKHSFSGFVPIAVKTLESAFPELKQKEKYVMEVIREEEGVFERTLKKGVEHFQKQSEKLIAAGSKKIPGELAFKLYESMGFPKDLTQLMAEEKGMEVDMDEYDKCWARHVEISKQKKKKNDVSFKVFEAKETSELENMKVIPTQTSYFKEEDVQAKVMAIYDSSKEAFVASIDSSSTSFIGVVLDKSSMYSESGGQIGDEGTLTINGAEALQVLDCQCSKGFVIHIGKMKNNSLKVGDTVMSCVNYEKRDKTMKNHTATHVLNWGLRSVLGTDVDQAGSLVNEDYLRFDFTSKRPLKTTEIVQLQDTLKTKIELSEDVDTQVVPLAVTKKIKALRAVFGETYPDPVRVVAVGCKIDDILKSPEDPKWFNYSIELCGGTHVKNASVIKRLVVMSEEAKGKNIRRMICLTEEKAVEAWEEGETWFIKVDQCPENEIKALSDTVAVAEIPLTQRRALLDILNTKKMKVMEREKKQLTSLVKELTIKAQSDKDKGQKAQLIVLTSNVASAPKIIKPLTKAVKDTSFFVVIKSESNTSVALSVVKSHEGSVEGKALFDKLKAMSSFKGGGKPTSLAGTCNEVNKANDIEQVVKEFVEKLSL